MVGGMGEVVLGNFGVGCGGVGGVVGDFGEGKFGMGGWWWWGCSGVGGA